MGWFRKRSREDHGEQGGHDMHEDERFSSIELGVPGRCLLCNGLGYIEHIDFDHRSQVQHCKDCGHRWEYHFDRLGRVVALYELDDHGRPMVVKRLRAGGPLVPTAGTSSTVATHTVLDLRDGSAGRRPLEVIDAEEADPERLEDMSPGEWLRHATGRR